MDELIRNVVILGGGTAGWMTASYLAKAFGREISITLVEAPAIPKIGVGEATIPNLQKVFFDFLGIPEENWMRACNASFKMGIKFINWKDISADVRENFFYHLFGLIPSCNGIPLSQHWAHWRYTGRDLKPLAYECYREAPLLDAKLSPRRFDGSRVTHYAWHFDAHLVADYLREVAISMGIHHVMDELKRVELRPDGNIRALHTVSGGCYPGDLFVDCSGFRGLLINQALEEPFIEMSDFLLCDSAVAASVPHNDQLNGVEPYTSAIGMKHGWTWKIPLLSRFGSGYVYSSKFVGQNDATDEFIRLWDIDTKTTALNQIKFRTGRNRNAWVRNCVAIGLSSCFLEPLESTGIYFIYAAIYQLAKYFPDKRFDPALRCRFNEAIAMMYDDCRDFIQAHYFTTQRTDTPFWLANKYDLRLSDGIRDKLEAYRDGLIIGNLLHNGDSYYSDFETEFRNFWTYSNYCCIFSGMGLYPHKVLPKARYATEAQAAGKLFDALRRDANDLAKTLPTNYDYLQMLHGVKCAVGELGKVKC